MRNRWSFKQRSTWALILTPALAIGGIVVAAAVPAAASHTSQSAAQSAQSENFNVKPNAVNELDCNGWSNRYKTVLPGHRMLCVDPHGPKKVSYNGSSTTGGAAHWTRFVDNGHYVGHDEPSVKFISNSTNSGNTMTYFMKLPTDPKKHATDSGSVVDYAELSPAPWFGLAVCDPASYPQNPCTPDSDSNNGAIGDPSDAGSAFLEMQFYPPGFAPFADDVSCSATKWCSAINIDSLESLFNFVGLNPGCVEPVNFAFLQRNGVPAGPPSPQLTDANTFLANNETLEMNPGDTLKVSLSDSSAGLKTVVTDESTGQTGFMVASAKNGFMNTNYKTCAGSPFTFHAEYATANAQNSTPWAALDGGVLMEQEIGHSEVCASLTNKDPYIGTSISTDPNHTIVDPNSYDTCVGGMEGKTKTGKNKVGEGGCNATTGVCKNAETEGPNGVPIACPSDNFTSGQLCEFADATCVPQGTRTVMFGSTKVKETSPVNFCEANRYQNGDLDYDGVPYRSTTWPNGSSSNPTSIRYVGPFDSTGTLYPLAEFETDGPGSESQCSVAFGTNCDLPPLDAQFYPYWTMTNRQTIGGFPAKTCTWNFGNVIKGITTQTLGGDAEYGLPELSRYGGTSASAVFLNPESTPQLGCGAIKEPKNI